jgi:hypothetical protein
MSATKTNNIRRQLTFDCRHPLSKCTNCETRHTCNTLFDYLDFSNYDGALDRIHPALCVECREQGDREATPTAIIDSQSVNSAEKGERLAVPTYCCAN